MTISTLELSLLESFYHSNFPSETPSKIQEMASSLAAKIAAGKASFDDFVLILDSDSQPLFTFSIFPDEPGVFGVRTSQHLLQTIVPASVFNEALKVVCQRFLDVKAQRATLRFTRGMITEHLPEALLHSGFSKSYDRIEFKTPLKDLPTDVGSPFQWKPMGSDVSLELAAQMMMNCGQGDPTFDPQFDCLASIENDLKNEDLYSKSDAIQIGYLQNEPAAFIFAQVDPKQGWSRITYMGLLPKFRSQGLSTWLHRHGFEMLRSQGGIDYHGGTSSENPAMLATFRKQGCKLFREMEEWTYFSQ